MGLLDNVTPEQYYGNDAPISLDAIDGFGNYQFVTAKNIIDAFMIAYVGEGKNISKVKVTEVQFHALRAIQELSYDVLRSFKAIEIEIPPSLTMILPQDYVNYVKIVRVASDGIERILYPTSKTSNPFAVNQYASGNYQFSGSSGSIQEQDNSTNVSDTWQNYQSQTVSDAYSDDSTDLEIDNRGRRYGLDPQHAQSNGSFYIDRRLGKIHFSSALSGQTVTLKYVSDGLGTDEEMVVHKFCEEAIYKHIAYAILSSRTNIPEYIIGRYKKEKFAETRKAKIRLSNIKMEEFTQVLKGLSKPIK